MKEPAILSVSLVPFLFSALFPQKLYLSDGWERLDLDVWPGKEVFFSLSGLGWIGHGDFPYQATLLKELGDCT